MIPRGPGLTTAPVPCSVGLTNHKEEEMDTCETCRKPEHEACSLTEGCHCCEEALEFLGSIGEEV